MTTLSIDLSTDIDFTRIAASNIATDGVAN